MERIKNKVLHTFIVVEYTLNSKQDYEVVTKALNQLGHQVIIIELLSCPIDSHANIEGRLPLLTLKISKKK